MKVEIDWSTFPVRDLVELLKNHVSEIYIDGDKKVVVAHDPDEYVLEELENRGYRYRIVD